jgi:hypothetical protein
VRLVILNTKHTEHTKIMTDAMECDPSATDGRLSKLCPTYGYDWCPVIATRWWLDALRLRAYPRLMNRLPSRQGRKPNSSSSG